SAKNGDGVGSLMDFIGTGRTVAVVGSSGVGKSTLINALIGREVQKTGDVRESNFRGRHTTTRREMILLPGGGVLIDTPGLRELQLWHAGEGVQGAFRDIDRAAADCRFVDCTHTREPRCGVLEAVARGEIPAERFESYRKLRKELDWLEDRETIKGSDQNRKLREAQRGFNRVRSGKKRGPVRSDGKKP
ncbi:MAG: ribosome small subunit-dependent GTPase A, partial [Nitrospirae bacterium]|nr:ribosome small subunit-dependent GTPase A [Nitrospirota bacterium]